MNIKNIDLRLLRYFLAVAEELSFSRAALRLHMSQPPLSQQIQELETRIETKLFVRTKRKVELTPAGHYLVPLAKKLLHDLEDVVHATRAIGCGQVGELRIGTIFSAPMAPAFGAAIRGFRMNNKSVRLTFREMRQAPLLQALANNDVDIAFMWKITPLADKYLRSRLLSADPMSFYVSHSHPLAAKRYLEISDFVDETLFLTSLQAKMAFSLKLQELARKKNISLRVSEEASHFPVIANLIASGSGLGVLPNYVAKLATSKLVEKKLRGLSSDEMKMPLAVFYCGSDENALLRRFLEAL